MKGAQDKGVLKKEEAILLNDLFKGSMPTGNKAYTVFRSTGTPMQNVAILKLIMQEEK
jgi:ornithine cyclodeaminase/alanine dehydrogenase-like protein (mu-crystallin family)